MCQVQSPTMTKQTSPSSLTTSLTQWQQWKITHHWPLCSNSLSFCCLGTKICKRLISPFAKQILNKPKPILNNKKMCCRLFLQPRSVSRHQTFTYMGWRKDQLITSTVMSLALEFHWGLQVPLSQWQVELVVFHSGLAHTMKHVSVRFSVVGLSMHWIAPKLVHALLFKTALLRIVWSCGTMWSSAGNHTAFAICIWGGVRIPWQSLQIAHPVRFEHGAENAHGTCVSHSTFWCEQAPHRFLWMTDVAIKK